ncbi:hypothetical protein [Pollutibacter soli]|uniref:hypothetical protein n=1 Tax=Pollutibacter soli TaxID=3034157 RepID=UPI0030133100
MKFFLLLSATFLLMFSIACNSGDSSKEEETVSFDTSSSVGTVDTTKTVTHDPDPTDSIGGDDYNFNTSARITAELVRNALANDIFKADLASIGKESRKFSFHEFDLNGDGQKEVFVKLSGPYFCGSGGCSPLLLSSSGKLITKFSVTEYPIIIAPTATNRWLDLIVTSGAAKPTMHLLKYDGSKYPANPSTQPLFSKTPEKELPRVLDEKIPSPTFTF